jgi:SAM-dependent methyltransferase
MAHVAMSERTARETETDEVQKPFSPPSERNREPILEVLREWFADRHDVLEIGSGTGQHAVYFAKAMPHLKWQTSDVTANIPGIRAWLDEAGLPNTPSPIHLDVNDSWPNRTFDALFSANTLHIMGWEEVERFFDRLQHTLAVDATVAIYGPFNYEGRFTSDSNAAFDADLKRRSEHMGIRDFEAVNALAIDSELKLVADVAMPANNRLLVWRRP